MLAGMDAVADLWLRRARDDLRVARFALEEGMLEQVTFHCQQALEKTMKAILIDHDGFPAVPKTHDLVRLSELLTFDVSTDDAQLLRKLSDEYISTRYGADDDVNSEEIGRDYLRRSQELAEWLRQQLS